MRSTFLLPTLLAVPASAFFSILNTASQYSNSTLNSTLNASFSKNVTSTTTARLSSLLSSSPLVHSSLVLTSSQHASGSEASELPTPIPSSAPSGRSTIAVNGSTSANSSTVLHPSQTDALFYKASVSVPLLTGSSFLSTSSQSVPYGNFSNASIPTSTRAALLHAGFIEVATPAAAATSPTKTPKAKKVFAHYMLGTVTQAHAQQDIDEAIAMGIDGFAFNIGDPSQSFVPISLSNLIGYAEYRGFSFYFSLDVYASGNACYQGSPGSCGGPSAYKSLLADNLGSSAWYKGPNGKPMISTYSSGGETNTTWADWRTSFAQEMYFIPDFDETSGYYEGAEGWYDYWGDIVDGLFSWEAAWPYRSGFGGNYPGDISPDLPVLSAATNHSKGYMMALSALQYKDAYGANVYRAGDVNLPTRMANILAMAESPDFIQIITWNDGPESHYIGNLWYEQNNDSLPYRYANAIEWDHSGWQPLIASFITAWKANEPATKMAPPSEALAIGALWYKTILDSSTCPVSDNALIANYSLPPDGIATGTNQLNYALVIEAGGTGYSLSAYSNGIELGSVNLVPGLNYGAFAGAQAGYQQMFLWNNGALVLSATTGRCISAGCPDCVYNMNLQVVAFAEDTGTVGDCPYSACKKQVFAHYMVGNVDEDHAHTDIDNAVAMGLDGFALNVGDPTQDFVTSTFEYMFDYTAENYPDFHLFVSMDLWAEGNSFNGVEIDQYHTILANYKGHAAYLQGPDGNSFVSSFSSGGLTSSDWDSWRESWADEVYLVPDFDDTAGYNTSDPGWWAYWGGTVQGAFSWESAWPVVGESTTNVDYSFDQVVIDGTFQHVKSYMMPLSPLQYKDSYNTNYFRGGNLNLPERMVAILGLNPSPDFVEYITWNDGPESHYIGNLWLEQNNDTQPGLYANPQNPHTGWQPLITSFITAFKSSLGPDHMLPPSGSAAVGAIWYNSIMTTSVCPNEALGGYNAKPDGFETATDSIYFAIVLGPDSPGAYLRAISNDEQLPKTVGLYAGLNYGSFSGIFAGHQSVELVAADGSTLLVAEGGRCISSACPDCIYNLNPVVVGFGAYTGVVGDCSGPCNSESGSGVVYVDPIIFVEPSPIVACYPPCTLVMPPSTMPSLTTISFAPISTSVVLGGSTIIQVSPLPLTTSVISFWNMPVPSGENSFSFALTTSLHPMPLTISAGGATTTIDFPPVATAYSGPEVVIISQITYTVIGGFITIDTTQLSIPPAATTAQMITVGGFIGSIPASIDNPGGGFYTLPTTVITSNGVTQTFSEAQFTEFATISASTTITTALTYSLASSSTTVIPFWIQKGGFYWSPIPFPTAPHFPIPTFPSFPPIPDPPCFKLFDIFSIDCPPDKTKQTTEFSSGPPQPTCTAHCGTVNTEEESSSDSSSCSSATVTDYFVSCSSTSCTTTSSEVVSGCQITATTTTTGLYCSATITQASDDDQGDDDPPLTIVPESVDVGGIIYTVSYGQIVVDGTTLLIPDVSATTVEIIGDSPVTIYPGATYTLTNAAAPTSTTSPPSSTTSALNPPICSPTGTSAGGWISPAQATSLASSFCSSSGGKTVPPGISDVVSVTGFGYATLQIEAAASEDEGCEPITIDTDRCLLIFDNMFTMCTTDNGEYYGGEASDGCYYYIL